MAVERLTKGEVLVIVAVVAFVLEWGWIVGQATDLLITQDPLPSYETKCVMVVTDRATLFANKVRETVVDADRCKGANK